MILSDCCIEVDYSSCTCNNILDNRQLAWKTSSTMPEWNDDHNTS